MSKSLDDLLLMYHEEEDSDDPISLSVYNAAHDILQQVPASAGSPAIASAGNGDVVFDWYKNNRIVRVVILPEQEPYVYHRGIESESAVIPLTQESLALLLSQLSPADD